MVFAQKIQRKIRFNTFQSKIYEKFLIPSETNKINLPERHEIFYIRWQILIGFIFLK
jgi:hypothetical protein